MLPQLKNSTKRFDHEDTDQTLKKAFRRRPFLKFCINNKTLTGLFIQEFNPFVKINHEK